MDINEYIASFTATVIADADAFQVPLEESFLQNVGDKLVESEIINEYKLGYFKKKVGSSIAEISGFSYEPSDGTYNLFVVDDLSIPEENFTNTLLNKLVRRAESFIKAALDKKYIDWEESSYGYESASELSRLYSNRANLETELDLKKIHIFVLTNKTMGARFKNEKRKEIKDVSIDFSVYDATRLYDMAKAGFEKEPVDIDLKDFGIQGIYAIKSTSVPDEFESYLATIPGNVLANIYLEKGNQVLEGNVRSFLSVRGKVNKGIRKTILEKPEKFFILNNGITVTSTGIEYNETNGSLFIQKINDMQIVNGGQTTASLANAIVKDKANLKNVQVMMKLSVLANHDVAVRLVPEISRASNSQNKIDEADFFSNHPYHVKIEELSKKNLAPAVNGNQYQTEWFYERARGQYTVEQMKLTASQAKSWQLKHPKNQVIKKTDLAKYMLSYDGYPNEVSRGAQAAMKKFSSIIQGSDGEGGLWATNSSAVNSTYFKNIVSKAIIFKETEKLVSSYEWYKEIKAYRANIVTYTISLLAFIAKNQGKEIDLNKIWLTQKLYPSIVSQIEITAKQVYDFLISEDRTTQNVTEWAKREECWKRARDNSYLNLVVLQEFLNDLKVIKKEKKSDVTEAVVDSMDFVLKISLEEWKNVKEWGTKYLYLTPQDQVYLELAEKIHTHGKIPSDKQFKAIVKVYNTMISKGYIPLKSQIK